MTGLVAAEIRKLRTVRTTWVLTFIGLALVALGSGAFLFAEGFTGSFTGTDPEIAAAVDQVGANSMIVLIVAILAITLEFRHGTIGRTLQLTPSRMRMLASKVAVVVLYALAFFVIGLVIAAGLVLLAAATKDASLDPGASTWTALWQGAVGLTLNALFGVAIGALLRSQVVTITIVLVWLFVAENLAAALAPEVGRWLPFQALQALFTSEDAIGGAMVPYAPLDPPIALAVFFAYVAVAIAGAAVLMRRRDV